MIFLFETLDFLKIYQNGLEVLKNISLMTYCSSQFGELDLFVSNKEFVDAELFRIFLYTCLFVTPGSFFYHILGIFAVQVGLDAFVLYVAMAFRMRE